MMRVRTQAVADQLAVNLRIPFSRVLQFFDQDNARSFPDDESVAVAIPWSRGALRIVIARTQRLHRAEAGKTDRDNGRLRAAGHENIRVAKLNHAPGLTDGIVRGRAGGNDAHVRSAHSEFHRD